MRKAEIGDTGKKLFTPATICGLIVFFMFSLQCISTIVVSRKETVHGEYHTSGYYLHFVRVFYDLYNGQRFKSSRH